MRRLLIISALWLACSSGWATTYYVGSGGNDSSTGTLFSTRWLTIQKAADTAAAGDLVLVCDIASFTPAATVDFDTNAGAFANPIRFRGCNSDGSDDGTVATISGSALGASSSLFNINIDDDFLIFENLRLTDSTQYGVWFNANNTTVLYNCRIDSHDSHGIYGDDSGSKPTLIRCRVDSNGGSGTQASGNTVLNLSAIESVFDHNAGDGWHSSARAIHHSITLIKCMAYRNGDDGFAMLSGSGDGPMRIVGCTSFANTGDAYDIDNSMGGVLFEWNLAHQNGGYGLNSNGATSSSLFAIVQGCSFSDNSSGATDFAGGLLPVSPGAAAHVQEDPAFTSEVDGSENLTPTNSNLYKTIALPSGGTTYEYIGAIQPQFTDPGVANVRNGTTYQFNGTKTGTVVLPAQSNVRTTIGYDAGGTSSTGSLVLPLPQHVRRGVTYD